MDFPFDYKIESIIPHDTDLLVTFTLNCSVISFSQQYKLLIESAVLEQGCNPSMSADQRSMQVSSTFQTLALPIFQSFNNIVAPRLAQQQIINDLGSGGTITLTQVVGQASTDVVITVTPNGI